MTRALKAFIRHEALTGLILAFTTVGALLISNSELRDTYLQLLSLPFGFHLADFSFSKPINLWVNDGLMAVFFFFISLEIKREIHGGELSDKKNMLMPFMAALGGVLVPALVFYGFTHQDPASLRGWAIPTATDIAFSLGILSLLGRRVPVALKLFLTALAVIDDIAAIIIIALWYSNGIQGIWLLAMSVIVAVLACLHHYRVKWTSLYLAVGLLLWWACYHAGIHPTISGVLLALFIPHEKPYPTMLHALEHDLAPWVKYLIMPLFALCNAGVPVDVQAIQAVWAAHSHLFLGIVVGLLCGKQIGVLSGAWIAVRFMGLSLPARCSWRHIYGVACLCGFGFTMSLFIGALSIESGNISMEIAIRMGVLCASLFAGLWGYLVLRTAPKVRS